MIARQTVKTYRRRCCPKMHGRLVGWTVCDAAGVPYAFVRRGWGPNRARSLTAAYEAAKALTPAEAGASLRILL